MNTEILSLNPNIRSAETNEFHKALREKIVGQDEGVQALVDLYQVFCAGLNSPGRPVGNLLLLGPTGSGKTRIVEAAAEILFDNPRSVIKIDCAEFQHSHEIAKLIGSPPGYLGHRETHPLITQEALSATHTDKLKLSFLLFDEIEKASDALWQLLLGMLDKATLTLGDNRRVDLTQTVIFMTSNLGGGEITEMMVGGRFGFIKPEDGALQNFDVKLERTAVEAARRKFSPEFMNRLDKIVVFQPLQACRAGSGSGHRTGPRAEARAGHGYGQIPVPRDTGGPQLPAPGGNRPAVRCAAPEAGDRALHCVSAGEPAGHATSYSWRSGPHRLGWRAQGTDVCARKSGGAAVGGAHGRDSYRGWSER